MTLSLEQENNVLSAALMLVLAKNGGSVKLNVIEAEAQAPGSILMDFDEPGFITITRITGSSKSVN